MKFKNTSKIKYITQKISRRYIISNNGNRNRELIEQARYLLYSEESNNEPLRKLLTEVLGHNEYKNIKYYILSNLKTLFRSANNIKSKANVFRKQILYTIVNNDLYSSSYNELLDGWQNIFANDWTSVETITVIFHANILEAESTIDHIKSMMPLPVDLSLDFRRNSRISLDKDTYDKIVAWMTVNNHIGILNQRFGRDSYIWSSLHVKYLEAPEGSRVYRGSHAANVLNLARNTKYVALEYEGSTLKVDILNI